MSDRKKVVTLNRDTDIVSMNTPAATWNGDEVRFNLTVSRKLRSGVYEDTEYDVTMTPEDALCAYRRLREGIRHAVSALRERAEDLEGEL